ncbi:MAG: hypothetical protein ABJE95_30170 [Byssovorax sp.]
MRLASLVAFAFAFPAGLLGCSGDTATTAGSSSSGDGPSPTAPEGAVNVEIYASTDQTCPVGNVHVDLGNSKLTPPTLETDGWEGASVVCSVTANGSGFSASGTLKKGAQSLTFKDVSSSGMSTTGTISFKDPAGAATYTSPAAAPCVFQFAPGTAQGIEAGKTYMQFDCTSLVNDADPKLACSARYGYVLVDRCAGM